MSWTCPGHYKVHVHGRDSPGRPVHRHCPVPLPALTYGIDTSVIEINRSLALTRNNLNIITITHTMYL